MINKEMAIFFGTIYRVPVSMGVVGASAPIFFESVGVSIHAFWQFSILPSIFIHMVRKMLKFSNFFARCKISTHSLKFLTGPLICLLDVEIYGHAWFQQSFTTRDHGSFRAPLSNQFWCLPFENFCGANSSTIP